MNDEDLLYTLALTRVHGLGLANAHQLLQAVDHAADLFRRPQEVLKQLPGIPKRIIESLTHADDALRLCEAELQFAEKNHIRCLTARNAEYPSRLRECPDAPLVLFYRGNADLNHLRVIAMVGTRNATDYGKAICQNFLRDLQTLLPDTLVVSGLAYGVDIYAHRAALQNGMETVGVLAHGLDRLYPAVHRQTAAEMTEHGGLLTEFTSGTNPDRQNFVKRNRIVAGMSDATIVVESAEKGGALITAEIADSYHRDCFAFPGRINDPFSAGCNNLIKGERAMLLQSAEEFVKAMRWDTTPQMPQAIQRQLFPELTDEEQRVCDLLQKQTDGVQVNTLVVQLNIPINRMTGILFELEMKGVIRTLAGGVYKLV